MKRGAAKAEIKAQAEVTSLDALRAAVQECRACPLYEHATQGVIGEGRRGARIFFIGEQPGDVEDRKGRPFVGPAGKILDKALAEAGIDRADTFVTNAVKHFKFEERGKRRIHKKPNASEIKACEPWLSAELELVKPKLIVCLGATAAQSVLGREFRLTKSRGETREHPSGARVLATIHPSALLRAMDAPDWQEQYDGFVRDLRLARDLISGS